MQLTIVICTHNRAVLLENTLISLNQAMRPHDCTIDILVVLNACTDNTIGVLNNYKAKELENHLLPLRWSEEPRLGKSYALNNALLKLTASYVAFVDDDHRVDSNYLVSVLEAFTYYPEVKIFCGRIFPDWDGSEPAWVYDDGPYCIRPLPVPCIDFGDVSRTISGESIIPGGGNIFLRREIYEIIGHYSVNYGPVGHNLDGAEDLEWIKRAFAAGIKMQYIPGVVQYHFVDKKRLTLQYIMHKAYIRSASIVRLSVDPMSGTKIPLYMLRKILKYIFGLFSISQNKRRFFLVRLAATIGEIKGYWQISRSYK